MVKNKLHENYLLPVVCNVLERPLLLHKIINFTDSVHIVLLPVRFCNFTICRCCANLCVWEIQYLKPRCLLAAGGIYTWSFNLTMQTNMCSFSNRFWWSLYHDNLTN